MHTTRTGALGSQLWDHSEPGQQHQASLTQNQDLDGGITTLGPLRTRTGLRDPSLTTRTGAPGPLRTRTGAPGSLITRTRAPGPLHRAPSEPGRGSRTPHSEPGLRDPSEPAPGPGLQPPRPSTASRPAVPQPKRCSPRPLGASELPNEIAENVRTTNCIYWAKGCDAPRGARTPPAPPRGCGGSRTGRDGARRCPLPPPPTARRRPKENGGPAVPGRGSGRSAEPGGGEGAAAAGRGLRAPPVVAARGRARRRFPPFLPPSLCPFLPSPPASCGGGGAGPGGVGGRRGGPAAAALGGRRHLARNRLHCAQLTVRFERRPARGLPHIPARAPEAGPQQAPTRSGSTRCLMAAPPPGRAGGSGGRRGGRGDGTGEREKIKHRGVPGEKIK